MVGDTVRELVVFSVNTECVIEGALDDRPTDVPDILSHDVPVVLCVRSERTVGDLMGESVGSLSTEARDLSGEGVRNAIFAVVSEDIDEVSSLPISRRSSSKAAITALRAMEEDPDMVRSDGGGAVLAGRNDLDVGRSWEYVLTAVEPSLDNELRVEPSLDNELLLEVSIEIELIVDASLASDLALDEALELANMESLDCFFGGTGGGTEDTVEAVAGGAGASNFWLDLVDLSSTTSSAGIMSGSTCFDGGLRVTVERGDGGGS